MRFVSLVVAATLGVVASACGGEVVEVPKDIPTEPKRPQPPPEPPLVDGVPPEQPPQTPVARPQAVGTCLTLLNAGSSARIATVDLAKGTVTPGVTVAGDIEPMISSIAVAGDEIFACEQGASQIARISRTTGAVSRFAADCSAVAADKNGFYVLRQTGAVEKYASAGALLARETPTTLGNVYASRLGTSKDGILAAWHSTSEVLRLDGTLQLEGYDDWIFGLAGVGDQILVSSPRATDKPGLLAFDAKSGKKLGVLALASGTSMGFMGLSCAE
ncbi:MAG: hypothetical protein JST00_25330 [Deltaproteobacteria bacterium]|nr:hypothetical protein [Deltaproteobacteria bacterium]